MTPLAQPHQAVLQLDQPELSSDPAVAFQAASRALLPLPPGVRPTLVNNARQVAKHRVMLGAAQILVGVRSGVPGPLR